MSTKGPVVWSSETGRVRETVSGKTDAPAPQARGSGQQTARLLRDRKGRAGKTVTLVEGLTLSADQLDELARELRRACGTGGTIKDGAIEIQGDLRDRIATLLQERGYKVKLVGG